jgi:cellulose synthase operon protein C
VLSERLYREFVAVKLRSRSRPACRQAALMDAAIEALGRLVDYEIAEVTAAATFYMARPTSTSAGRLLESRAAGRPRAADLPTTSWPSRKRPSRSRRRPSSVHEKNLELLRAGVFNPGRRRASASSPS